MNTRNVSDRISRIEQEIVRKERLARDAKNKGMHTTYSNYVMDISALKVEMQKLATGPLRQASV
jgi:hypothetical protein